MIVLRNLTTTNHRKSGESEYDRKLTELDVVDYANPVPYKRGPSKLSVYECAILHMYNCVPTLVPSSFIALILAHFDLTASCCFRNIS